MKRVPDPLQMKAVERIAIEEIGIPSLVLMERAAHAAALELKKRFEEPPSVLAVCGTGNNGADGLALARILKLWGWSVSFTVVGDPEKATGEWKTQYNLCKKLGVEEVPQIAEAGILVDALFGIGLSRPLSGRFLDAVQQINALKGFKLAIDVPSGISCRTGAVMGGAVMADLTVTFQFEKAGLLLYPGRSYCGELVCADIGIPESFQDIGPAVRIEEQDLSVFNRRPQDSNKGTFGRVLVIAGSVNMCGAAILSALAACRTGAGLAEVYTPWENRIPLQARLPEAVLTCYDTENPDDAQLKNALDRADAVVLGPGLSTREYTARLVKSVLKECRKPLIIDADALNIIAGNPEFFKLIPENAVLTPHVKELSRLTGKTIQKLKEDPMETAQSFAKEHGVILVMKDAATVIAAPDGRVCINTSGCSAMATGGSGDVLTGILGARFAADRKDPFTTTSLCVCLHGLAGEEAAKNKGEGAVLASDIADSIGTVLCRI